MNEVSIEKRLKMKVSEHGGLAFKLISPGFAGVPDRLVLFNGAKVAFVELKAPAKKLRALQRKRKKQLEALGFKVYKIDSFEAVDRMLEEMIR
ncbi:VRR-NUC domain-containing protein [Robertmurraya andreesenii]|uniref:G:T-mismatch repair DNA endonuclease (Very short patch repair protein) n=1 Tax=Anoxybacillus andreesenii TaxID=1325932 RepID=A0ABT9UZQ3_9BACL|nr:VRR-NUC domain-containing protein [Robertmurraya andreesenii]MDQ0154174.1 G:T-mismatch repair DNA endonuclease (very short patch repair protein) [Robertmurraya andreesenii]